MTGTFEHNHEKANALLARYAASPMGHLIGAVPVSGDPAHTFVNFSPVNGDPINTVYDAQESEVNAAVAAAQEGFAQWRKTSGKERGRILHNIADLIVARAEEIALLESMDTGQPIRYMGKAALRGAENFRFFGDRAHEAENGLSLPGAHHHNYTVRQPIGPVAVITPWNTPFMLSTWKIAPALAAGCSIVHKPAEWSPLTAMILAEIMAEAGLPKGVNNLINGRGEVSGKLLTEHPGIKAVAFVGDSKTGVAIMGQGAATLKRVHFELGGKNPVVVFADADFERALDAVLFMIFSLNGERCTSSSRLLVEGSIHDSFLKALSARIDNIRGGHPLDPATEIGPLIHPVHAGKVRGYLERARADGLHVHSGAEAADAGSNYVPATLISNGTPEHATAQEEIFGPVLTATPFEGEDQAIEIANNVPYGLAGYVWTENMGRGLRMSHALEAGMVWVNSDNVRHLPSPFGGMKASGIGRDGGDYSFDFYMETKNISLAFGRHAIPKIGVSDG